MKARYESQPAKFIAVVILLTAILGTRHDVVLAQMPGSSIKDQLRSRIEAGGVPLKISVGKEIIHAAVMLPVFYERRGYHPAWANNQGPLSQVEKLLQSIRGADREGLRPGDYHLDKIEAVLSEVDRNHGNDREADRRLLADLDLLLTDAFLIYGAHLLAGRTDPEKIHPQWYANRREADLAGLLEDAINRNRVDEALSDLLPNHAGYGRLRESLAIYRKMDETGGWPAVPSGSKLQPGDRSERVSQLRQRLAAESFLKTTANYNRDLFDAELEQALKAFQAQNGLEADGILGRQTLQALNISAKQRRRQIVANLERWRWLPRDLGDRYVLVNIAGFNLEIVERQKTVLHMRVVTGKTYRKTPVFSDKISYLVINPDWGVPDSIARKDILPKVKKDPEFLRNKKFRVFEGWAGSSREIRPETIDWDAVTAANLSYHFRQDPGSQNALGRIKFMFPNQFDVYLHDTPSKELFVRARRDFSSGCIRVEKPIDLAEYLLQEHPDWPPDKIRSVLTGSDFATRTVKLDAPLNIHILYWTAWVDDEGRIHFQPDIYDRDSVLDAALQMAPPRSMK